MRTWIPLLSFLVLASPAFAQEKPSPKIAVVVAGDPDELIRTRASNLEGELTAAGLRTPVDPALRSALLGEPSDADDGLGALRALRRGLGLEPKKDLAAYRRIGMIAGADALVVVRQRGELIAEVFDVSARQFYEGVLDLETSSGTEQVKFVRSRAVEAQARWSEPKIAAPPAPGSAEPTAGLSEEPVDQPEKERWIKKAWPYFVLGALAIAGTTYLIIDRRRDNGSEPPVLRFRPGED